MERRVSAVLLAAGSSARMGRSKELLPLGDKPVIRHCVDAMIAADIRDIVVVVRPDPDGAPKALTGLPVTIVENSDPKSDMAGSVRTGLRALDRSSSGVLVCLVDHPLASSDSMKELLRAHRESPDKIIIPAYNGRRGHPSLFPMTVLQELFVVETLRDIVKKDGGRVRVVDVSDEGVVLDMDTREDYERVLRRMKPAAAEKA